MTIGKEPRMTPADNAVDNVGAFAIGGDLRAKRFGFGAMRLTGPGVWGPPDDPAAARAVLRRAVALGITFIDTADVYGPGDNERLIREALAPYPRDLVIATKGGMVRTGPATQADPGIGVDNSAAHLRAAVERSLRNLGVERIDLYQLHRVDPAIPIEDTMDVLGRLRDEGKIRHIGLSDVSVVQIARARATVAIATVQNAYNLADRRHDDVLAYCERHEIGFIAFYPQRIGALAEAAVLRALAARHGVSPSLIALAWLLARSPATIAIPGTSSGAHLEENVAACAVALSRDDMDQLDRLGRAAAAA
jgi:aryl-alcohol dehydrogenase-like predicted oxidoreductase